jgi:hypothetical protein
VIEKTDHPNHSFSSSVGISKFLKCVVLLFSSFGVVIHFTDSKEKSYLGFAR